MNSYFMNDHPNLERVCLIFAQLVVGSYGCVGFKNVYLFIYTNILFTSRTGLCYIFVAQLYISRWL